MCFLLSPGDMGLDNSPNTIAQMKGNIDSTDFYLHIGQREGSAAPNTETTSMQQGGDATILTLGAMWCGL